MPARFNLSGAVKGLSERMGKKLGESVRETLPSMDRVAGEAPPPVRVPGMGFGDAAAGAPQPPPQPTPGIVPPDRIQPSGEPAHPASLSRGLPQTGMNPATAPMILDETQNAPSPFKDPFPGLQVNPANFDVPPGTGLHPEASREWNPFQGGDAALEVDAHSPLYNPWGPGLAREDKYINSQTALPYPDAVAWGQDPFPKDTAEALNAAGKGSGVSRWGIPIDKPKSSDKGAFFMAGANMDEVQTAMSDWANKAKGMDFNQLGDHLVAGAQHMGYMAPVYERLATLIRDRVKEMGANRVRDTLVSLSRDKRFGGQFAFWYDGHSIQLNPDAGLVYISALHEMQHATNTYMMQQLTRFAPEIKKTENLQDHMPGQFIDFVGTKSPVEEIVAIGTAAREFNHLTPSRKQAFIEMVKLRRFVIDHLKQYMNKQQADYTGLEKYTPQEQMLIRALGRMDYGHLTYMLGSTHEFEAYSFTEPMMMQILSLIPHKNDVSAMSHAMKLSLDQLGVKDTDTALVRAMMLHEQLLRPNYVDMPAIQEYSSESMRTLAGDYFRHYANQLSNRIADQYPHLKMVHDLGERADREHSGKVKAEPHADELLKKDDQDLINAAASFWASKYIDNGHQWPTLKEMEEQTPKMNLYNFMSPQRRLPFLDWVETGPPVGVETTFHTRWIGANPEVDTKGGDIDLGKFIARNGFSMYHDIIDRAHRMAMDQYESNPAAQQFRDALRTHLLRTDWAGADKATQDVVYNGLMNNTFGADAPMANEILNHTISSMAKEATAPTPKPRTRPSKIPVEEIIKPENHVEHALSSLTASVEHEDGATLNLDGTSYFQKAIVVSVDSIDNVKMEDLTPEFVRKFVVDRLPMINNKNMFKVGLYKFPGENRISLDLNLVLPHRLENLAADVAEELQQHSYLVMDPEAANPFRTVKTGATGTSTKKLSPDLVREIASALGNDKLPAFMTQRRILSPEASRIINRFMQAYRNWKTGGSDELVDAALATLKREG